MKHPKFRKLKALVSIALVFLSFLSHQECEICVKAFVVRQDGTYNKVLLYRILDRRALGAAQVVQDCFDVGQPPGVVFRGRHGARRGEGAVAGAGCVGGAAAGTGRGGGAATGTDRVGGADAGAGRGGGADAGRGGGAVEQFGAKDNANVEPIILDGGTCLFC